MSSIRLVFRAVRPSMAFTRPLSTTSRRMAGNAPEHEGNAEHRRTQAKKPLNPHLTNTTSTIINGMPSVGAHNVPPEFITSADSGFVPKDSVPENMERMTGGAQMGAPDRGFTSELEIGEMGVGEMEGGKFKIEPLRRTGEDANTTRARLLCSQPL
jgi:hypothetical protein